MELFARGHGSACLGKHSSRGTLSENSPLRPDFYQESFVNPEDQIISIYFKVKLVNKLENFDFKVPFDQHQTTETILGFRWIHLSKLQRSVVSLPIDQHVVELLLN